MIRTFALALLAALATFVSADDNKMGHSRHGTAFDSGLRGKPWKMEGLGNTPFAITCKNPEVQEWFNQGIALMHSFWFEEAERTFRWCHKLEPDNAMVYFGLAFSGLNWFSLGGINSEDRKRYRDFLNEAIKRKDGLPERERLYIEAWEACLNPTADVAKVIVQKLQDVCVKYPSDIEAKALLGLFNIGNGSAMANDALLQEVLRVNPMHPGAHHARIHNWDGVDSAQAIASCELYGKAAPGVGHALHMPGHIYTKVGMWHEAAIAMDSATRVELRYMNERLALPYETWNYAHNRDYLSYIQEQLGRADEAIQGGLDIANSPTDPEAYDARSRYPWEAPLLRALVKFERWVQILDDKTLPANKEPDAQNMRNGAEILALIGTGKLQEAKNRFQAITFARDKRLAEEIAKSPDKADRIRQEAMQWIPSTLRVAEARLKLADGDRIAGLQIMMAAAAFEAPPNGWYGGDPPGTPWPVMRLVGDVFAEGGDHRAAIGAYEKALVLEPNDAWCLAGLAKSWAASGDRKKAADYAGRLLAVWDGADRGLKPLTDVLALKLDATPHAVTLKPERNYDPRQLEKFGPSNWRPFAAPDLQCVDPDGKPVKLSDFKGKNVLLVFYLSDQCVHCVEQLTAINAKAEDFEKANTVVLACSSDKPEKNKANNLASFKLKLLSDSAHGNARRFSSYDDFEDMELHSTILIDKDGRVRWKRTGGDPFKKVDFLLGEIARWPK